ncbi:MAG TPA: ABC transporter ATP-binding protein [Solirubrobacterales bacterium]|nr:ABC transporter ATP-binding protein [Solirubrobacterales bacterium]
MSASAISVRGLRRSYGEQEAVAGIDFEVAAGEVFGFLGPNGAGKTTTIEILEGYRERSGGEVEVLGVDPGRPTREWRARVGLVLQECELDPLLTVREAISLFATFYPAPRPVEETIELTGLGEKREARIGSLSGGQKRRVDVAIGIIGDPDLIFLDEPTTGFDPTARRGAWNMIEGLKALGKTVFLTTHYMEEAQHLSDRVAILREGRIVAQGPTSELGASLGRRTVIGFRLNGGLSVEDLRSRLSAPLQVAGNEVSIETEQPQRDLYRLLALAEERDVTLTDLEVRKPSLEDIFLDLTSNPTEAEK